jgi:tetratricopeptide (TPR) repeat protein
VQTLLGTIYMAQGASERALACFDEALEDDPSDLSARFHRGEARLDLGDLLLAREDLDYVLESGTAGSPLVQQALRLLQRIDELKDRKRR